MPHGRQYPIPGENFGSHIPDPGNRMLQVCHSNQYWYGRFQWYILFSQNSSSEQNTIEQVYLQKEKSTFPSNESIQLVVKDSAVNKNIDNLIRFEKYSTKQKQPSQSTAEFSVDENSSNPIKMSSIQKIEISTERKTSFSEVAPLTSPKSEIKN
jgi:hypothetical protein